MLSLMGVAAEFITHWSVAASANVVHAYNKSTLRFYATIRGICVGAASSFTIFERSYMKSHSVGELDTNETSMTSRP